MYQMQTNVLEVEESLVADLNPQTEEAPSYTEEFNTGWRMFHSHEVYTIDDCENQDQRDGYQAASSNFDESSHYAFCEFIETNTVKDLW